MPTNSGNTTTKTLAVGKPPSEPENLKCPRCDSTNTKFCYYNNYNFSQPRHFCKCCRRYWTAGGTLRDIPVGGGTRRNTKRQRIATQPSSVNTSSVEFRRLTYPPAAANIISAAGAGMMPFARDHGFSSFFGMGVGEFEQMWPFYGVGDGGHGGGGVCGGQGGGGTWQMESGGGGESFVLPELAISTPGYAIMK